MKHLYRPYKGYVKLRVVVLLTWDCALCNDFCVCLADHLSKSIFSLIRNYHWREINLLQTLMLPHTNVTTQYNLFLCSYVVEKTLHNALQSQYTKALFQHALENQINVLFVFTDILYRPRLGGVFHMPFK